jgi:hypothetical protein
LRWMKAYALPSAKVAAQWAPVSSPPSSSK